jgi:hypothetical protein
MFGKLKEKLKNWVKKNQETQEIVETPKKTTKKKTIKKKPAKKEKTKIQEVISPEEVIEEKPQKKKFSLFRKELTEEKFEEMFEELGIILLQNNVAYDAVDKIKNSLKLILFCIIGSIINVSSDFDTLTSFSNKIFLYILFPAIVRIKIINTNIFIRHR